MPQSLLVLQQVKSSPVTLKEDFHNTSKMDAAILDTCVKALLSISTNTAKELYKWDPEGMVPAVGFPHTISSINWPGLQLLVINFNYTSYLAEGKQASARKHNNCIQDILIQQ